MTTIKGIVQQYLKQHGYDGLVGEECGCAGDMPCSESDIKDCRPGYRHHCSGCQALDCEWRSDGNAGCFRTTKQEGT
jgi:hypothetical protein